MIYLDHNATTRCDERVVEAMQPYWHVMYGNPSSLYRIGRMARSAIDTAREQVAALIDAPASAVIFTSGGTEANALAIGNASGKGLAISAVEHPSVTEYAWINQSSYRQLTVLPVDQDGLLQVDVLSNCAWQPGDLASVMLANNETGAIQNIVALSESLAAQNVSLHTDAVQALGKLPVSFRKLGVVMMTLSSHKIYGPKGCGALVCAEGFPLRAVQHGGEQEHGLRAGTENVPAIVGFGKAADLAKADLEHRAALMLSLRRRLEDRLRTIPGLTIFADQVERLPNTVQFGVAGISGEMLLMQLDQRDFAVSSGSACKAGSGETSHVLAAMGVEPCLAHSAIRVSLGKDNSEQDIDQFITALRAAVDLHQERT